MRPVLLGDAIHLAAALVTLPPTDHDRTLALWIDQTRAAAKYLRRFGHPHPRWGDGSLTSRAVHVTAFAGQSPIPEGRDFLRALSIVARHLSGIGQTARQGLS